MSARIPSIVGWSFRHDRGSARAIVPPEVMEFHAEFPSSHPRRLNAPRVLARDAGAHELGHVLGALLTGGEIATVVLHPLTISHTEMIDNPHPLVVVWTGPLVGVMLPLILWGLLAVTRVTGGFVARFFAGFCLITNGAYLGVGSFLGDENQQQRPGQ